MRRRNLIIASDSDEEGDAATTASVSASVASGGGGGGGSVGRPSSRNPSRVHFPFPSSPPPSPPVEISDDEEEVDEIQDPDGDSPFEDFPEEIQDSDGDSPFVDVPDDLSPPPPAPPRHPPPPPPAWTPTPPPAPAPARTPTPTPPQAPPPAGPFRAPTPTPPPATASAPPSRTPTPTPTPPAAPLARTPTPTPPSVRTPTPTPLSASTPPSALSARLRLVDGFLRRLGLRVRPEWLESCAAGVPGFDTLGGTEVQARRCFEQFLFADMNACGAGVLPEGVGCMDAGVLDGPFVLQVDEIVNISAPLRERYRDVHAGPKRCLKLSMTDGIQRIYGMEYRPIKDLEVLAPAGFK